jgi:hypothetical protein
MYFMLGDQVIQTIGDNAASTRGEDIANKENVHLFG